MDVPQQKHRTPRPHSRDEVRCYPRLFPRSPVWGLSMCILVKSDPRIDGSPTRRRRKIASRPKLQRCFFCALWKTWDNTGKWMERIANISPQNEVRDRVKRRRLPVQDHQLRAILLR